MVISMLKIRRPLGRLIFNMGIAIPGKTVFLIETAPRVLHLKHSLLKTNITNTEMPLDILSSQSFCLFEPDQARYSNHSPLGTNIINTDMPFEFFSFYLSSFSSLNESPIFKT